MTNTEFRFSFGPWNISEGGDPFGPDVREAYEHDRKFALYKQLGFDGVQFHDDDVVPGLDDLAPGQIESKAAEEVRLEMVRAAEPSLVRYSHSRCACSLSLGEPLLV